MVYDGRRGFEKEEFSLAGHLDVRNRTQLTVTMVGEGREKHC
jgi:hypothetical protein